MRAIDTLPSLDENTAAEAEEGHDELNNVDYKLWKDLCSSSKWISGDCRATKVTSLAHARLAAARGF